MPIKLEVTFTDNILQVYGDDIVFKSVWEGYDFLEQCLDSTKIKSIRVLENSKG